MVMRGNCSQSSPEAKAARGFDSLGKDDDAAGEAQGRNGHCRGHHHVQLLESLQHSNVKVPAHPQCAQGTQERSSGQVEQLESFFCLARAPGHIPVSTCQQCWGAALALPKQRGNKGSP